MLPTHVYVCYLIAGEEDDVRDQILVGLLGALGVVLLIIIVLVVVVLVTRRKKSSRPRRSGGDTFEPPPPYAVSYDNANGAQVIAATGDAGPLPQKAGYPPSYHSNDMASSAGGARSNARRPPKSSHDGRSQISNSSNRPSVDSRSAAYSHGMASAYSGSGLPPGDERHLGKQSEMSYNHLRY